MRSLVARVGAVQVILTVYVELFADCREVVTCEDISNGAVAVREGGIIITTGHRLALASQELRKTDNDVDAAALARCVPAHQQSCRAEFQVLHGPLALISLVFNVADGG